MIRLTATLVVALPLIAFAWTIVGLFSPDVGMHDGNG